MLLFEDITYDILLIQRTQHNASLSDDVAQITKTRPGNLALFEYKT